MKPLFHSISITLFLFVILVGGFIYLLPNDTVTTHYATLEAAHDAHLFGRGWLPNILPSSTYDIQTSNHLDSNTSVGKFSFEPSQYKLFSSHVQHDTHIYPPFSNWENTLAHKHKQGFQSSIYATDRCTWIFFCKPLDGFCEYMMWLH